MPQSLRNLQLEHQGLGGLLDIMDEWVRDVSESQAPDYQLLQVIADYFLGYPDEVHHPKEDLIFLKLQRRDADAAAKLSRLLDEHRELQEITREFAAIVGELAGSASSSPEQVVQSTNKLVDYYRHHIEMEEEHFFPTAERLLTKGDWADIDFAFSERTDPLLYEAETKYKNLRAKIARLRKES